MSELADTTDHGVQPEQVLQDPLAHFLASHQQLLNTAYRYIRSRVMDSRDAEEIHSDMLIGFIVHAEGRNWELRPSELTPLMIDIAKKRIIDRVRAAKRRPCAVVEGIELELLVNRFGSPRADDVAARLDVRRALEQLSSKQRNALVLRYFDGFAIKEVMAIMKLSRTAVNGHLEKGLAKLRSDGVLDNYKPSSTTGRTKQVGTLEAQA